VLAGEFRPNQQSPHVHFSLFLFLSITINSFLLHSGWSHMPPPHWDTDFSIGLFDGAKGRDEKGNRRIHDEIHRVDWLGSTPRLEMEFSSRVLSAMRWQTFGRGSLSFAVLMKCHCRPEVLCTKLKLSRNPE
jgi:hypothetical protein